jgi:7,8-dihydropterin-6-yl-methyl-4-(beta-D-ribofuranosyl)aminobenzene 5'-phosphate synthase
MNSAVIKIIYDNCKAKDSFQEGWGFSCLIDLGPEKILFDTGADLKAFFSNQEKLEINLEEITSVFFSHNHADHTTGLEEILKKLRPDTRLFLPKNFPAPKVPKGFVIKYTEGWEEILPNIYSLCLKGGSSLYEQALAFDTPKGIALITGCAHPGIVHLLKAVKEKQNKPIYFVLGGFHLLDTSERKINEIIQEFKAIGVRLAAPCHCSAKAAIKQFQEAFQENFFSIGSGSILTL